MQREKIYQKKVYGSNVKIPTKFLLKSKYYIVLVWICKYCIKFDNELFHQKLKHDCSKDKHCTKNEVFH